MLRDPRCGPRRILDQFTPANTLAAECRALRTDAHIDHLQKDRAMFNTAEGTVYSLKEAFVAITALQAQDTEGYTYHYQGLGHYATIGVYDADRHFVGNHTEETSPWSS